MARVIYGTCGAAVYPEVLSVVRRSGERCDSRNGLVYDLTDVTIQLETPVNALPIGCGRKLSPRIAAAEALQLIGGFSEPAWLCRIAPQFDQYREGSVDDPDGRWFHGAYGNRIGNQLETVVRRLREHSNTRQATVTLWSPDLDDEDEHLDYPCTVALNFRRAGRTLSKLNMQVLMRSNDCWRGTPYDLLQFTQLQLTLCNILDLEPGTYTHHAWSLHLYVTDVDESYNVTDNLITRPTHMDHVTGVGRAWSGASLADVQARARALALTPEQVTDPTDGEKWYVDLLREFSFEK